MPKAMSASAGSDNGSVNTSRTSGSDPISISAVRKGTSIGPIGSLSSARSAIGTWIGRMC
jgi:hypothetical protein